MPLNARSITVALKADVKNFQRGMKSAAGQSKGLSSTLRSVAGGAAMVGAALGAVAAGSVVASIKAFANFDAKMTESLAIMGDVSDGMKQQMSDAAREIGTTTKFSADQAAEAYFFLASAGLDAQASMAALPQVAQFAQAGNFDLAQATDLLTDAQSALGKSFKDPAKNLKEMTHLSDVLVKANTLANTSVRQVSEALTNKLAGALRAANIPLEEGVAVLAKFADQGLKGAAAGEAYQMVLRDLKRAATENSQAFEDAGIAVFDQNGNFRNMADIVDDLSGAYGGLSVEQQTYLTSTLGFQQRSFKNIQMLMGTGDAIRSYQSALEDAGGVTKEVAEKQMLTLNEQFGLLKSKVTDIGIGLGQDLAPTIQDELLPALGDMVDSLGDLAENVGPTVIAVVGGIVDGFQGLIFFADKIGALWSDDAAASAGLIVVLKKMRDGMFQSDDAALNMANALWALGKQGPITADGIDKLAEATGATADEQMRALQTAIDYAYQVDQVTDSTRAMEAALGVLRNSAENTNNTIIDGTVVMDGWMVGVLDAADATKEQNKAQKDANVTNEKAIDKVLNLADALKKAEQNQRGLASALLEMTDPTFKAAQAVGRMKDAEKNLADVQKDKKSTDEEIAQAQLDYARSIMEAQASLDQFSTADTGDQIRTLADTLGISDMAAHDLLETLGLLDGTEVTTVVNYEERIAARGSAASVGHNFGGIQQFAAGGMLGAGQPAIVGERGPELFIPATAGQIVPNGKMGSSVNINVNSPNTNDLAADIQTGTVLASVLLGIEGGQGL